MKLGNLSFAISIQLIFFDFTYLGSQEKVNLQDLQPTFEEETDAIDPEKDITEVVDIPNLGGVYDSTGGDTIIQYSPTNTIIQLDPIGGENPQDYWVTLLDPNNQEDRATILNDIRESQEREEREKNYKETEYYETDSEKRERENAATKSI